MLGSDIVDLDLAKIVNLEYNHVISILPAHFSGVLARPA
jgi:hypothetical protein